MRENNDERDFRLRRIVYHERDFRDLLDDVTKAGVTIEQLIDFAREYKERLAILEAARDKGQTLVALMRDFHRRGDNRVLFTLNAFLHRRTGNKLHEIYIQLFKAMVKNPKDAKRLRAAMEKMLK